MSGRRHARHVRLFRSEHYLLPEYGCSDNGSDSPKHCTYSDDWFILFVGSVAWFVSVCWRINYVCCDFHDACCYCTKYWDCSDYFDGNDVSAHWDLAGNGVLSRRICRNVSVCWRIDYVCSNYHSTSCYCAEYWNCSDYFDSSDDANNYLCGYYNHIHIAANVSGCDSVYVDRRHLPLDQTVLRLIYS